MTPSEPILAAIRKCQDESQQTQDKRRALLAKLAKVEGVTVRQHWNGKDSVIEAGPFSAVVSEFGSIRSEPFYLENDIASEFCAAIAKFKKRS